MLDFTTAVGLDVHARSIKAVAFNVVTGEVAASTFGYDAAAVSEWIGSLEQPARAVYESGVTGFDWALMPYAVLLMACWTRSRPSSSGNKGTNPAAERAS